ncbi:MAG: ester cyclase [Jatrophihabitans sp.]|uniref:ester cyclase n=1 Tax=Jatrophihabitans sp. TaxID=1932789 RepID=UPI0039147F39
MTVEQNKQVVGRYYSEVLNEGRTDLLSELALTDYVEHDPLPGQGDGRDDFVARVELLRSAFAPLRFTVEDVIAEGDRVVVRWSSTGRHTGEFVGIPPTDREYTISGIDIHRLDDGRMAEHWHVVDQLSQLQQLGLFPVASGS